MLPFSISLRLITTFANYASKQYHSRAKPSLLCACLALHVSCESLLGYYSALGPVFSTPVPFHFPINSCDFDYLHGVCVGQAANPGPWNIQVRNVVSASKHIDEIHQPVDCMAWSETSATKVQAEHITRQARKAKRFVNFSAFAPARSKLQDKGGKLEAVGTLLFSNAFAQNLGSSWEAPIFHTARVSDSLLHLPATQVRVITLYGFHSGMPEAHIKNDRLLACAFAQASHFHVPTLIVGDLNIDLQDMPAWHKARSVGFVDVALRQAAFQQSEPDPTYRGISRLDYVIGNPLAAQAFVSLRVDPRGYSAMLCSRRSFSGRPCSRNVLFGECLSTLQASRFPARWPNKASHLQMHNKSKKPCANKTWMMQCTFFPRPLRIKCVWFRSKLVRSLCQQVSVAARKVASATGALVPFVSQSSRIS